MADVIVIAGTGDGRKIIEGLAKLDIKVAATVATCFGGELLRGLPCVEVHEGRLDSGGMAALIKDTGAGCLVDASHPFAAEASLNAMAACERAGIPYLRFEREETHAAEGAGTVIRVKDFGEAAVQAARFAGNIFLATGSNNLEVFIKQIPDYKDRLYVRVLPESGVIARCEAAGLTAGNIIGVKGPFSEEMNVEMLKHCSASVMVTKDSGETGGTEEKLKAAARLGIPIVLVGRPKIVYTNKVESIGEVIEFVKGIVLQG